VEDQVDGLAGEALVGVAGDLVAEILVLDRVEPVVGVLVAVEQADRVGVVVVAVGQEHVVVDLGEAGEERLLLEDRVEDRVERVDAEVADLLDLLVGGQAADQRERGLAQGLDLVELLDAVEVVADVDLVLALDRVVEALEQLGERLVLLAARLELHAALVGHAALGRLGEQQRGVLDAVAGEVLHRLHVRVEVPGDLRRLKDELAVLGLAGHGVAGDALGVERRGPDFLAEEVGGRDAQVVFLLAADEAERGATEGCERQAGGQGMVRTVHRSAPMNGLICGGARRAIHSARRTQNTFSGISGHRKRGLGRSGHGGARMGWLTS
jgi:hypothetical protein